MSCLLQIHVVSIYSCIRGKLEDKPCGLLISRVRSNREAAAAVAGTGSVGVCLVRGFNRSASLTLSKAESDYIGSCYH